MKKIFIVGFTVALFIMYQAVGCNKEQNRIHQTKQFVAADFSLFKHYIQDTLLPLAGAKDRIKIKASFLKTRLLYKRLEWATEYFMPTTTRFVNGPPLPEIEAEENKIFEAEGLQVIEEILYTQDSIDYTELNRQIRLLIAHAKTYINYWEALQISEAQILDAIKLQVFRMAALGLSGFDAAHAKSSIPEIVSGLQALQVISGYFEKEETLAPMYKQAISYAVANTLFDEFDRMLFIRRHLNGITKRLTALQQQVGFVNESRLLKPSAATLFDTAVFDVNAYIQDSFYAYTRHKQLAGEKLFYDPVLSGNGKRSCASCHQPQKAFTDGLVTSISLGNKTMKRNTPTLLNAALQPWQFYDMRTTNLENQSSDVITNRDEMHGDLFKTIAFIKNDPVYKRLFAAAFPKSQFITEKQVQNVLAVYVRSLTGMNSRFDQHMQTVDNKILTREEEKGFNLFMGKAKCGSCHFMPLFNGTVPPAFIKMESEVIGVPQNKRNNRIDPDSGRYLITKLQPYLHAFKTTTVRNAALTAPYMHNGVYATLNEVIDFYNNGGGVGTGLLVENQTLAAEKLNLTTEDKAALIAFIKTLTDLKK